MSAQPAVSGITMAFASSAGRADQPGQKALAAVAKHPAGFPPTPPNSISPNLPAYAMRTEVASPPPMSIDSASAPVPLSKGALSGLESAHEITASTLARDYLPAIMLGHGPVAIKHVMGCLTQSVPGFSRIPPARARRLVVAALESRAGGGHDGHVEFEKVGWGRWDAHVKGEHVPDHSSNSYAEKMSPPTSEYGSYAVSQAGSAYPIKKRKSTYGGDVVGASWAGSSMPSVDEGLEYMSMSENEADNMSLDGSETNDSMPDSGEETEDEDWAAMGAAAIRKTSISTAATGGVRRNYNLLCIPGSVYNRRFSNSSSVRKTSQSLYAKSAPQHRAGPSFTSANVYGKSPSNVFNNSNNHTGQNQNIDLEQTPQERDAIQALLTMGSMAQGAHKWKSMTVEEIQQYPEYPYTNWPLEAKKKGKLDVAHGRGGPLKIAWEVHGDGPIKLVWIMGLGSIKEAWQRQTKDFGHTEGSKYSVLILDNRGMGGSDKPLIRYSTSEMARDVVEVLDHLSWTEPRSLHVAGISMGGMISQELGLLIPERISSLCLVSTAPRLINTVGFIENLRNRINLFIPRSLDQQIEHTGYNLYTEDFLAAPDQLEHIKQAFPTNGDRFAAGEVTKRTTPAIFDRKGFMMQAIAAGWHHKSEEQIKELGDKVGRDRILVLHGTKDRMITFYHGELLLKELGGESAGVTKAFFEGQGHVVPIEKRKEFHDLVAGMVEKGERLTKNGGK